VRVQGKERAKGIAALPPAEGCCTLRYRVRRRYDTFVAGVALNDTAQTADLERAGTRVVFEVRGDGASLWRSQPIVRPKHMEQCSVQIVDVQVLELVVHCPGSNASAHAAWIDPALVRETDRSVWYRHVYGSVSAASLPDPPEPPRRPTALACAASILACLEQLAEVHLRRMRTPPPPPSAAWEEAAYDLESPFAVQVSTDVLETLADLLESLLESARLRRDAALGAAQPGAAHPADAGARDSRPSTDEDRPAPASRPAILADMTRALLVVLSANFRRMDVSRVDPAQAGFAASGPAFEASVLPRVARLLEPLAAGGGGVPPSVRLAAAEALWHGRRLLTPSPAERLRATCAAVDACCVVELEVCWPVFGSADGSVSTDATSVSPSYERALLLLQMRCRRRGWRHKFLGSWMRLAHLVIEVPAAERSEERGRAAEAKGEEAKGGEPRAEPRDTKGPRFLRPGGDFAACLFRADFGQWKFPYGDPNRLPMRVETSTSWDRAGRLAHADVPGCVHVYGRDAAERAGDGAAASAGDVFDQVCDGVEAFRPWEGRRPTFTRSAQRGE
jgi:hypothetical protein